LHRAVPCFNPFAADPDGSGPYDVYRELRDSAPVYGSPEHGFWALSRFDDVLAASRDWGTFSNADGVDLDELGGRVFGPGDFLDMDPPGHDELRAVVKGRFTPKAVASLEPLIRQHVRKLLADLPPAHTLDAVGRFAWPLPNEVMSSIMGFPQTERSSVRRLYAQVMERAPGQDTIPPTALAAAAELREYFVTTARERRRHPESDVMTMIATGEVRGRRLPEAKLAGMCFVLFSAGIDTVASLLGSAILLVAQHASVRELALGDPDRLPLILEEVLRYESPLQFNARTTTVDAAVRDKVIPAGARVLLLYGAANRDERRFDDADVFDVKREPKRHLAFGDGIHFCIGAPLARLQTRIALEELLSRHPRYEVDGPVQRSPAYNMRSLSSLPISL
jgi:cytochrome P450